MLAQVDPSRARDFLAVPGGSPAGGAARPLSPTERRETPSAMPRPGVHARQPARGPTMWAILWLCWPMLAYRAGNVGPCCGYVGLCWPHVDAC